MDDQGIWLGHRGVTWRHRSAIDLRPATAGRGLGAVVGKIGSVVVDVLGGPHPFRAALCRVVARGAVRSEDRGDLLLEVDLSFSIMYNIFGIMYIYPNKAQQLQIPKKSIRYFSTRITKKAKFLILSAKGKGALAVLSSKVRLSTISMMPEL